jgi:hypothetical protein
MQSIISVVATMTEVVILVAAAIVLISLVFPST